MQKSINMIICISIIFMPQMSSAGLNAEPVYVKRVAVDTSGHVYVRVEPELVSQGYARATCSINTGWSAVFNGSTPAGQVMTSLVISAKLSQSKVRLIGSDVCTLNATVENMTIIDLLP